MAMEGEVPVCMVCMEILGYHGGPASLPCGHNGCLACLQKVKNHSKTPNCPMCRTYFDPKIDLKPNLELKEAISLLSKDGGVKYRYRQPELTFGSVMSGLFTVACRKVLRKRAEQTVSGEEEGAEDDEELWGSVLLPSPSAPSMADIFNENVQTTRAVLDVEPPDWLPDSSCISCSQCAKPFRPWTCGRHHCRFCGGLFCGKCSTGKALLPKKFREREPQRVCDACYEKLQPVQTLLLERFSNAAQRATHDVTDYSCMRSWVNSPLGLSMEHEIYKATNSLRNYAKLGSLAPEKAIPEAVLKDAQGVAILTVVKAGCGLTYKGGTGLVVSKLKNGTWSAPSAIACAGLGWGPQIGGEITDLILVLRTMDAVRAFGGRLHFALGAECSVAAGPIGRNAKADVRAGDGGAAACYSYSLSKGAFIGLSVEGSVFSRRGDTNARFYGDAYITTEDILSGNCLPPRAAAPLYSALHDLFL